MYAGPVFDACISHCWANQLELMEYMSAGWREYLGTPKLLPDGGGMITVAPSIAYLRPGGEKRPDAIPPDGAAGSSYDLLKRQVLDPGHVERAVLSFDAGAVAMALINPYLTLQIATAANDWNVERWLSRDDRLRSLVLAPCQLPEQAAEEIRRVGKNDRIVGVLMGGNGLGKAFGHPIYDPIYRAAQELDLTIVIKSGSEAVPDSMALSAGAGEPATYSEFRILESHSLMTQVTTMITQGVFSKFPSLRVLIVGGGALWLQPFLWRFDSNFKGLRREVPWVKKLPSEYFQEHFRIGTFPLDKIPGEQNSPLRKVFSLLPEVACFTSCYPNWDSVSPDSIASQFSEADARKIMYENGASVFNRNASVPAGALARRKAEATTMGREL